MLPLNCKGDSKPPTEGSVALQLERGVLTTRLQSINTEERTYCRGSKRIENTPLPLVVALETTFPTPHCSCTRAFGKTGVEVPLAPILPLGVQNKVACMRIKTRRPLMSPAPAIGIANAATIRETKRTNFKAITQLQCIALLQLACRNAGHLTSL